jgi:hypothetical protein
MIGSTALVGCITEVTLTVNTRSQVPSTAAGCRTGGLLAAGLGRPGYQADDRQFTVGLALVLRLFSAVRRHSPPECQATGARIGPLGLMARQALSRKRGGVGLVCFTIGFAAVLSGSAAELPVRVRDGPLMARLPAGM